MKKNELIQSIKVIVLGLVFSLCIGLVSASGGSWTPTGAPSVGTNADISLNVGNDPQTKTGPLTVDGSFMNNNSTNVFTSDGVATDIFWSTGNAILANKIYMGGVPGSSVSVAPKSAKINKDKDLFLKISKSVGLAEEALAQEMPVGIYDWNSAGALNLEGNIRITSLAGDGERSVCMDTTGKLKICGGGTCGSANGTFMLSAPSVSNLCSLGSNSSVSGSGPWVWSCDLGGVSTNCSTAQNPLNFAPPFTTNGNFTVPTGVTKVYVTAIGAGGGGGGSVTNAPDAGGNGYDGGDVLFNNILVARGGKGGYGSSRNSNWTNCTYGSGGLGGTAVSSFGGIKGQDGSTGTLSSRGSGGVSIVSPYGNGGQGGGIDGNDCHAGGGGAGSSIYRYQMNVTPGSSLPVVIGVGGNPGLSATVARYGIKGNNGYLKIEW